MATTTKKSAVSTSEVDGRPVIDLRQTRDVLEQIALIHQAVGELGPSSFRARLLATRDHLASLLPGRTPDGQAFPVAIAATLELSGPVWVSRFSGTSSPDACVDPFRANLKAFLAALAKAGAQVSIADTFRPPERAYLMYWSWQIAKNFVDPQEAQPMAGVDIDWVHRSAAGAPDIPKSRAAASQMVSLYQIVSKPALTSRHTERRAIDMNISWQGSLPIDGPNGGETNISSVPHTGLNPELIQVAATYGVIKSHFNDPPHWSDDGA
jgi:hypothetical protein